MTMLETMVGKFEDCYRKLIPTTILSSAQITTERRVNLLLRNQFLRTSNFAMYCVEDSCSVIYFGDTTKPIFDNCEQIYATIIEISNF